MEIIGLKALQQKIARMQKTVSTETQKAIKDVAFDLLGESQRRAPVDTGDLRRSGNVKLTDNRAEIGYSTPYAIKQHEDLSLNHPRGGEAKYLERPLNEKKDQYKRHIADAVKRTVI